MNQPELELLFLAKFDLKVDVTELQQLGEWLVTSKSLQHTIHVTQPQFHVPLHKQSVQVSTVELTMPSSLNTVYQLSTPLALGDIDQTSTTDLLLTALPTHPTVD
ncbi:hypothetical protein LPJ67_004779, partial [Coemansia sp. RSA 1938]